MVAIKDMSMPKNCAYCRFRIYERCYITDKRIDNYNCPQIKDGGCPLVEAIPKADYETRLKADMVAMLTELKTEIKEHTSNYEVPNIYVKIGMREIENEVQELVQQKINALKETKDGMER